MGNLTVVLDIGQFSSKIGLAGEDSPSQVFLTMVGKPKYQSVSVNYESKKSSEDEIYVGDEIQSIGLYKIFHPIEKGIIVDWTHFKIILDYIFYNLRVDPTLVNILFAVHPLFPYKDLEKIFEVFLEQFQVMAFYPVLDSMLTLYSGGFQTGLIVEIGDSNTRIVPIYEGYKLEHAVRILDIGGRVLTRHMEHTLESIGWSVDSSIRRELVRVLKEKACFVSLDYKEDLKRSEQYEKEYSLPDGSTISLNKERFIVPEILFKPTSQLEEDALHVAIMDVIEACDLDIRPDLLNNIFLSGGSSMFPNLKSRIYQELELELARRKKKSQMIRIIAPMERTFSVWIGGSILALIPEFSKNWITRAKYFNEGIPPNLL
ncbi:MAG: actin, cytoplasmic 2 [Promethearchaeota archaeon]|nr:MAG: actin, cytoplasmic 2 [Candidatus Lokiarchaeota archaeon]